MTAARRMISERGFDAFTMADLAKAAGFAKGTLYLYFPTKEALFLAVLKEDLRAFFNFVTANFERSETRGVEAAAAIIARGLQSVAGFLPLLELVHTRLERNVPEEVLRDFKLFLMEGIATSGGALETFAGLAPGTGRVAFFRGHALAIGIAQMTNRTALLDRIILETPGLEAFGFGFEEAFEAALADQVRALVNEEPRSI